MPNTLLYPVAAAIGLALVVFIVFSIWSRKFGSAAVERWATTRGLRVLKVNRRSFTPHWRSESGKGFQFFRVTFRDKEGTDYKAWMRLESDCNEPEILDVIWDDKTPAA